MKQMPESRNQKDGVSTKQMASRRRLFFFSCVSSPLAVTVSSCYSIFSSHPLVAEQRSRCSVFDYYLNAIDSCWTPDLDEDGRHKPHGSFLKIG
jgi:hypothetical protein